MAKIELYGQLSRYDVGIADDGLCATNITINCGLFELRFEVKHDLDYADFGIGKKDMNLFGKFAFDPPPCEDATIEFISNPVLESLINFNNEFIRWEFDTVEAIYDFVVELDTKRDIEQRIVKNLLIFCNEVEDVKEFDNLLRLFTEDLCFLSGKQYVSGPLS